MPGRTSVPASARRPTCDGLVGRARRRPPGSVAGFSLILLSLPAGGCGSRLIELNSSEQFQRQVLEAPKPVMVHFAKTGCSRCWVLESAMEQVIDDYRDRVVFARYPLMGLFWTVTNTELQRKYRIGTYPTVVLFVNGQEKKRWVMHYDIKTYRKALNEVLGVPAARAARTPVAPAPARK